MPPDQPKRPALGRRKSSHVYHDITPVLEEPFSRTNTFKTSLILALLIVIMLSIFTPRSHILPKVPIIDQSSNSSGVVDVAIAKDIPEDGTALTFEEPKAASKPASGKEGVVNKAREGINIEIDILCERVAGVGVIGEMVKN